MTPRSSCTTAIRSAPSLLRWKRKLRQKTRDSSTSTWFQSSLSSDHRFRDASTSVHFHSYGGEPDGVDANHRRRSRIKVAEAAAPSVGLFTLTVPRGCCISTQIFDDAACEFAAASDMGNGVNPGCSTVLFCIYRRIHCGRGSH